MMKSIHKSFLFISTMNGDPWGGSEEAWHKMAVYLAKKGYTVHCVFYRWPLGKNEKITLLNEAGCKITLLTNPKSASFVIWKFIKKCIVQYQIIKIFTTNNCDIVIFSQGGYLDVTYAPFNIILTFLKNFIIISHNYNENNLLKKSRKIKLQKWVQKATLNMADSKRTLAAIKNIGGFDLPNQEVIMNPITIPILPHPASWPPLQNGNLILIVMAQLDVERKAQDVLIKTLSNQKWKNRNWQLLIYGQGNDEEMLNRLITENNLNAKISLKGHTTDAAKAYKEAHLILQITHIDSMPLSVTEAMSTGRACVVSNVGDMPVWIKDSFNGYIATSVTEKGIDEILEKAWNNKEHWEQAGKEAFKTFIDNYPKHYERFYEKIFTATINNE